MCAQLIKEGAFIDGELLLFNEDLVKAEKISGIEIIHLKKPSNQSIIDEGVRTYYTFDESGRLITLEHLFKGYKGKTDTTIRSFEYANQRISTHQIIRGKYRKRTDFFQLNDSTKIEKRFVKRGASDWELIDTEQHLIKTNPNGKGIERIIWIGGIDSKPYKRIIESIDEQGRLTQKQIWYGARLNQAETWAYDQDRLLTYTRNEIREGKTIRINYPNLNKQDAKGDWCINESCRTWSMVFNDLNLPKGLIFYSPETENIEILNFEYTLRH